MTMRPTVAPESPRILIADDQADVLDALRLLLKNEGFVIEVASSPRAVCDALSSHRFDILLMDLNYARDTTSGVEGLELLSRVREFDSVLPVVIMTAWGSIELAVEAMQGGGCDFIQKPWDNAKLLETLRRHVEHGRAGRQRSQQERLSEHVMRDMTEAREIQRRLLPSALVKLAGADILASWEPANDIGGDYYDAIRLSDTAVAFCIADVAGKGLPAALVMSNAQATVRAFARNVLSSAEMCRQVNQSVCANIPLGKFITFFYGVLDLAKRELLYSNAGHVPPVLIRRDGTILRLEDGGPVLGIFPAIQYEERRVPFESGDRLALITDGITEAASEAGEEFGDRRLIDLLSNTRDEPAIHVRQAVLDSVASFAHQGLQDDATLMIISAM